MWGLREASLGTTQVLPGRLCMLLAGTGAGAAQLACVSQHNKDTEVHSYKLQLNSAKLPHRRWLEAVLTLTLVHAVTGGCP